VSLGGGAGAAEPPPPLTPPDLTGPRLLALQSGVGAATGTEALFVNPAALAARRRYAIDGFYLTDRRPGLDGSSRQQDYFGGAVADSSTTSLAAGFGYARAMKGVETGTLLRLALALPLTNAFYLGTQVNYLDLGGADRVATTFNLDAGAMYQVTRMVSVGGAAYNLLSNKHHAIMPRAYALGFAAGSENSLQVVGDWRIDTNRVRSSSGSARSTSRFGLGLEYLLAGSVPVRAGFQVDDTSRNAADKGTKWWSLGAGWVNPRLAVDLGYRQSTTDPSARTIALALRIFIPPE